MMAALQSSLREATGDRVAMGATISPNRLARAGRGRIALTAAAAFSTILVVSPSDGDTGRIVAAVDPVAENRPQDAAPTNAESVTCSELRDRLANAGSLTILSGTKGWGDTFYGPAVPRCEFWKRPVFSYVNTRDGLCGVGYICVEKLGSAGGGM